MVIRPWSQHAEQGPSGAPEHRRQGRMRRLAAGRAAAVGCKQVAILPSSECHEPDPNWNYMEQDPSRALDCKDFPAKLNITPNSTNRLER